MIGAGAQVVMHRPPLKRIDFGPKRRAPEPPLIDLDCIAKFNEQERIWSLLRQSAEGCNAIGGEE
jgi:hypothetical protein